MKVSDLIDKLQRFNRPDAKIEIAKVSPVLSTKKDSRAVVRFDIHALTEREYRGKVSLDIVVVGKL